MSIALTAACWPLKLPPSAKLVLIRLADFASDDGTNIYPSIGRVAEDTGLSRRTVHTCISRLIASGHLAVDQAIPGRPTRYRIHLDPSPVQSDPTPVQPDHYAAIAPVQPDHTSYATTAHPYATTTHPPVQSDHTPVQPPHTDPLLTTKNNHQRSVSDPAAAPPALGALPSVPSGTDPEVATIRETAARCWTRGKRGLEINAAQIRAVQNLMDCYTLAGRPRTDVLQVMTETAGNGWQWPTFLKVAAERLTAPPATPPLRSRPTPITASTRRIHSTAAPERTTATREQVERAMSPMWSKMYPSPDHWPTRQAR